jgi:hypothetical protein
MKKCATVENFTSRSRRTASSSGDISFNEKWSRMMSVATRRRM